MALLSSLKAERSSWIAHWQDINQVLAPRTGRFLVTDTNRGDRRHNDIIDNCGTMAAGILSAGMMAGMSSPARPWFRNKMADPELNEYKPVKAWLQEVTRRQQTIFSRSNTYRALHSLYDELGLYGTEAGFLLPDFDTIIHNYPMTVGEYCIAADYRGDVNTLVREFQMTVSQVIKQFGLSACSQTVKSLASQPGGSNKWVPILHVVQPRGEYDDSKPGSKNMAFESCYYETGGDTDKELRESGFKKFPALVPRWIVNSNNVYGDSPGMVALGDVRSLQQEQLRKAQGIDYQTNPPLQAPTALKNAEVNRLPGGLTYSDAVNDRAGVRSLFETQLDLQYLTMDIQDVRSRINKAFYADLFLMLANDQRSGTTATEIAERHEEKLLMLGPVLERLQNEMLAPLVERTFDYLVEGGLLPEPPEELQGQAMEIEFVSVLAQAQRAIGVASMDRMIVTATGMAQAKPDVLDKIDFDQSIDIYSDMLGVDPNMIVSDEKVAQIRQSRAQAMQQQAAAAQAAEAAKSAKTLSETDTQGQNALTDIMQGLQGYGGTPSL